MYVCVCKGITDSQIQQAIDDGADYKTLRRTLGVGTDCGQCSGSCKAMVSRVDSKDSSLFYELSAA